MTSGNVTEAETGEAADPQPSKAADDRLIDELVARAQAGRRSSGSVRSA
ncbi:hypothetical protein [Streptomyces sp. NPDC059708]